MAATKKIEDEELMRRLALVFQSHGYEGASLATISQATGLKKPSLYHRFPRGKEQMAEEVLRHAGEWIDRNLLDPLRAPASPRQRAELFATRIGSLYHRGKDSCLLNLLSVTKSEDNPFAGMIHETFRRLSRSLSQVARDAGADPKDARLRAEEVLIAIQGALVLSRGIGSTAPFRRMQKKIPDLLVASRREDR